MSRRGEDVGRMEVKVLDCPFEIMERCICAAWGGVSGEQDWVGAGKGERDEERPEEAHDDKLANPTVFRYKLCASNSRNVQVWS